MTSSLYISICSLASCQQVTLLVYALLQGIF
jgi:hypothetical protein